MQRRKYASFVFVVNVAIAAASKPCYRMPMLRVWCEHLPLAELTSPAVLSMLRRYHVHPIVAANAGTDAAQLAVALRAVRVAGLEAGVWPLLERERGYWPSERNVDEWFVFTHGLLDVLGGYDARPAWIAMDLEPPLGQVSRLLRRTLSVPFAAASLAAENMDHARYHEACGAVARGVRSLQARQTRVLGVTLPLAAHDLRDDIPLWQDMFETPWSHVAWDAAGIMAYGSIVSGASRGLLSPADARSVHQPLLRHLGRRFGSRAHVSIGITGTGVFGDEPVLVDPDQLAADAAAARAAGIDDIAVFCLEGILGRHDPESWLEAFAAAPPREPAETRRARIVRVAGAVARAGGRAVFRR